MIIKKRILKKKLNQSSQNNKGEIYHLEVSPNAKSSDKTFILNSKYSINSNNTK